VSRWPIFEPDEIEAAAAVLRSGKVNYWTGQEGRAFEEEFATAAGCRHAIAVSNGSVALELALHALGVGPGDDVIVTPRSFVASASCVALRGASPVFADVDVVSQNIASDTIRSVLTPKAKAIIVVHLAGWPCDMDPIVDLAKEHGLKVIEDCAQAHGARYKGRPVGSLGDVAAFSFCQDKIMTTGGEGGMLTTDDAGIWERAWSYKDHGKSYDAVYNREHPMGFRWLHESLGTNWRLTEMQAAVGRRQLRKLPGWVDARRKNAEVLTTCFERLPGLRVTVPPSDAFHSYYKYYVFVRPERLKSGWGRDRIMEELAERGVPGMSGICPEVYLEAAFDASSRPQERLPVARELGETSLMLPVDPTLTEENLRHTCSVVEEVLSEATG